MNLTCVINHHLIKECHHFIGSFHVAIFFLYTPQLCNNANLLNKNVNIEWTRPENMHSVTQATVKPGALYQMLDGPSLKLIKGRLMSTAVVAQDTLCLDLGLTTAHYTYAYPPDTRYVLLYDYLPTS